MTVKFKATLLRFSIMLCLIASILAFFEEADSAALYVCLFVVILNVLFSTVLIILIRKELKNEKKDPSRPKL